MLVNVKTETIPGGEMRFQDNQNLLNDPNSMLADTGETCNSTEWHEGMNNMKSFGVEDKIKTANGEEMSSKQLVTCL